ncbi:MAG TPA: hypothetical protein VK449_04465, partial [Anaerolineales bacterium]|nr:hypothetical protein [Anaerolineales bacterium]
MTSPSLRRGHLELTASRAAPRALEWLGGGRPAQVAHVFERAAYLVADDESVLLLAAAPLWMGPFTLLVDISTPLGQMMDAGEGVRVEHGRLLLGSLAIEFGAAEAWPATPEWPRLRASVRQWRPLLPGLGQVLLQGRRGSPFGGLLDRAASPPLDSIEGRLAEAA